MPQRQLDPKIGCSGTAPGCESNGLLVIVEHACKPSAARAESKNLVLIGMALSMELFFWPRICKLVLLCSFLEFIQ